MGKMVGTHLSESVAPRACDLLSPGPFALLRFEFRVRAHFVMAVVRGRARRPGPRLPKRHGRAVKLAARWARSEDDSCAKRGALAEFVTSAHPPLVSYPGLRPSRGDTWAASSRCSVRPGKALDGGAGGRSSQLDPQHRPLSFERLRPGPSLGRSYHFRSRSP